MDDHIIRRRGGRGPHARAAKVAAGLALLLATPSPAASSVQAPPSLTEPALTRAILEGVRESSPELAARRAELEAARARAAAVGFASPAVLSAEMDDVPDGFDVADASFRLEVGREFLTGGRSAAARALATTDVRSAEAVLDASVRRITARTLQHLTRIVAASRTAARLAAEDSLLVSLQMAVRDRFSVGAARYVDVLRLRTERLRVQNDRAGTIASELAARESLRGLAGSDGAGTIDALVDSAVAHRAAVEEVAALPPPPPLDSLLSLSGEARLAEAALARARASADLARAERRPRLAGSIGAQRRVEDGSSTFGPVLGASITLPFTAGGANRAAAAAAESEIAAAEAAHAATLTGVSAELASALARYEAARRLVEAFDVALLQSAREEREGALAAYRTGDLTLLELLDFERALARAEIEALRARAAAVETYAVLIAAADAGGSTPSPEGR